MPELPEVKKQRYIEELGLSEYDADQIVQSRSFCDVFEKAYEESRMAKEAGFGICLNDLPHDLLDTFRVVGHDKPVLLCIFKRA